MCAQKKKRPWKNKNVPGEPHNTLHYPNDIDKSLNEASADKIRKYRADYNNNPPSVGSFMTAVPSTCLGDYIVNSFDFCSLQTHRETDHIRLKHRRWLKVEVSIVETLS